MEDITNDIGELAATVKDYVNVKVEAAKLKAAEKTSLVISNLVAGAIVGMVFLFFLVFAGIAGACALSAWIGHTWAGFLIMAGIFLLAGWITWAGRERFIRIPVMNNIIHQLFKEEEAAGEED